MPLAAHFAAAGNLLRFDRFMDLALYDPDDGYYSAHIDAVGARGDFSTSATLSDLLADGIIDWIEKGSPAHLIEIGAGSGQLARAILKRSAKPRRKFLPGNRAPFQYHIVEPSPRLLKQQRRLLGRKVRWHSSVPDALAAAGGHAFLFSNELVDAFPVRVFECGGQWSELHLQRTGRQLVESWLDCPSLPESTAFDHSWPDRQRIEVHESYHHWLASWQTAWRSGELLTIDYGGSASEIYHRAPLGSLRGYHHHQRLTPPDLYSLPGRRDLTADVNFDDLVACSEPFGLTTVFLKTQRDFLLPHFDPASPHPADQFLLDEHGPGTAFKVLRQRRA